MPNRIGFFTVLGLFFLALAIISFLLISDLLFIYGSLLLGAFFVLLDVFYVQKHEKDKTLGSRLLVFLILVIIGFIALFIQSIILTTFLYPNAGLFTVFLCIAIYIPGILIAFVVFLLLIRTPFVRYIDSKNMKYFYIVFATLIVLLPIILGWSMLSPTYSGRQGIIDINLSSDGSRLLSISGGRPVISSESERPVYFFDFIIWNTATGNIIWNDTSANSYHLYLSPNGEYFVNADNNRIYSIPSGDELGTYYGNFLDWSANGNIFVTANDNFIYIWNTKNFSQIQSLAYNRLWMTALSPNGSKIVVVPSNKGQKLMSVINISNDNLTYLFNDTVDRVQFLSWSKDGNKLQMIRHVVIPSSGPDYYLNYRLIIWNVSDGDILHNISIRYELDRMASNKLMGSIFGKYMIYDDEKSQLLFFNLTGLETSFNIESTNINDFDLSYDEQILATGTKGIIKIRDANTGEMINTLYTPIYEIERAIPGFEISALLCAFALILYFKRMRNQK